MENFQRFSQGLESAHLQIDKVVWHAIGSQMDTRHRWFISGHGFPRRRTMKTSFSFQELRGAIRAWRRYGLFSLTPREAEIIDALHSRLSARPLSKFAASR
jgi:hypothetical protein